MFRERDRCFLLSFFSRTKSVDYGNKSLLFLAEKNNNFPIGKVKMVLLQNESVKSSRKSTILSPTSWCIFCNENRCWQYFGRFWDEVAVLGESSCDDAAVLVRGRVRSARVHVDPQPGQGGRN